MFIQGAVGNDAVETTNGLLSALPVDVWRELRPRLQRVPLAYGRIIYDLGALIEHVYFIESGVVSMRFRMRDESYAEVISVGREGMIGLPIFFGMDRTMSRASVHAAGAALRIPIPAFVQVAQRASVKKVLQAYTLAVFATAAQDGICSRLHRVLERCARQLLMAHDRVLGDQLTLTQQALAEILGVRRINVSIAARQLLQMGCIDYVRGRITVRDRPRLEAVSCECYAAVRRCYARVNSAWDGGG